MGRSHTRRLRKVEGRTMSDYQNEKCLKVLTLNECQRASKGCQPPMILTARVKSE